MSDESLPKEFRCAQSGKALYMPVITTDGVAYSYAALFDMFLNTPGQPVCKVSKEPIEFFPGVCIPLHHFLWDQYKTVMRSRRTEDEFFMKEKFGLDMPQIAQAPDDEGDDGFLEEFQCVVSGELAFEPCCLSSGSIVSAYTIPKDGFKKDPDRLIACSLHGQVPMKSATLEQMIKDKFPREYAQRANELAKEGVQSKTRDRKPMERDPQGNMHLGLGCDGCGMFPIFGEAWSDSQCPERVGFHLCDACYNVGYHRRVITGKFNQTHMPKNKMVQVIG